MKNLALLPQRSPLKHQVDLSFVEWVLKFGRKISAVVGTGVLLNVAGSGIRAVEQFKSRWLDPHFIIAGVQFFVIFFAVVFAPRTPRVVGDEELTLGHGSAQDEDKIMSASGYTDSAEWLRAKSVAVAVLEQFRNHWMAIWIFWLCLYFVLAILYTPGEKPASMTSVLDLAATFFNNCATLVFLFCYFILSQPTILRNHAGESRSVIEWHRWVAVLLVFTAIEGVFIALAFQAIPNDFNLTQEYVSRSFNWISGIASATVMALFVGRLDSKFLECPTWVLVLLYAYTAIQPLFALLGKEHKWTTFILINAALLLKGLLYLYLTWLFQTGRLLFYFVRVRQLYDSVGTDFRDFASILRRAG